MLFLLCIARCCLDTSQYLELTGLFAHVYCTALFLLFQKPVFEGIAHEALSECMESLQSASDAIKNKKVNFS